MSGDLLWEYVSFLSGFEGANGAQVFEDESQYEHTVSAVGNAQTDTGNFKFGSSALYMDNSGDYLNVPNHEAFDLSDNDFTLEAWIRMDPGRSLDDTICQVPVGGNGGWVFGINTSNLLKIFYRDEATGTQYTLGKTCTGFATATWYHVAIARQGTDLRFYWNGTYLGKHTLTHTIGFNSNQFRVGSGGLDFYGHIDELRVTNGAARYTLEEDYDVPDAAFERGPLSAGSPIPGAEENAVTIACFLKWELPERNVLLCDGGMLEYSSEPYQSEDVDFGAIHTPSPIDAAFGDVAEAGQVVLAPQGEAAVTDWWRDDLFDTRLRIWLGNVDADGYTVSNATLLADLLVDTYERRQNSGGEELLGLDLIGRAEKLFLINEGNVLSQRFHQSVFAGEDGMNNCTDLTGYLAWGAATPPRGSTSGGGGSTFTPRSFVRV